MMTNTPAGFGEGSKYLLRGFQLLKHPSIRWYVIAPLLINILIFASLTGYAIGEANRAIDWIMGYIPGWLDFLRWVVWVLFGAILLLVYGYSFALMATLLASPFYGLLAERTEYLLRGTLSSEPMTLKLALQIARRSILRELVKLGYFLPRILVVFIVSLALSFVPLINFLAPLLTFLWGAWSLSLQYTDYAADNNLATFTQLRHQASQQKKACLGFGGTVLVATSIPVLNLFTIPASVVAGTALWLDQLQDSPEN